MASAWNAVASFFSSWWAAEVSGFKTALSAVQSALTAAWSAVSSAVSAAWNAIASFFSTWWSNEVSGFKTALSTLESALSAAWNAISSTAQSVWNAILAFFRSFLSTLSSAFSSALSTFESIFSSAWNSIKSTTTSVWNAISSAISSVISGIETDFNAAVSTIGRVWTTLEGIFKTPVNFLINTVYTGGIEKLWNDTVGALGGPRMPDVGGLAAGGKVTAGAGPLADDVLARVSKGETVVSAAHSQLLAPLFGMLGIPGYATGGVPAGSRGGVLGTGNPTGSPIPGGGVVNNIGKAVTGAAKAAVGAVASAGGDVGSFITGAIKDAVEAGKIAAAIATGNPTALANALEGLLGSKGTGGAAGIMAQVMTSAPGHVIDAAASAAWKAIMAAVNSGVSAAKAAAAATAGAGSAVPNVGSGVERWRSVVLQALSMTGYPASFANSVLYQMQTESGGNPNIVNNWDINAQEGHPSEGLMQVIGPTFAAYHVAGTSSNIFDPLANVAAALNYNKHAYPNGGGIGSGHGYDSGGWLPTGTSIAVNNTGRPERVIGPNEASAPAGKLQIEWVGTNGGDELLSWIRKNIRIRGGNVQNVLGKP